MECCKGGDLQRYVDPDDPQFNHSLEISESPIHQLTWIDIWRIVSDIAGALCYCHYGMLEDDDGSISLNFDWTSVLHRDIKAANSEIMCLKLSFLTDLSSRPLSR